MFATNDLRRSMVAFCCVGLACSVGCGASNDGYELAPVTGVVLFEGKPLEAGSLMFTPESGPASQGIIAANGEFSMETAGAQGAVVGRNTIIVVTPGELDGPLLSPEDMVKRPKKKATAQVPTRYGMVDQSGLEYDVQQGANKITIELTAKEGTVSGDS